MDTVREQGLEEWVLSHAEAARRKLYFTINGDVPLTDSAGSAVVYQIPVRGKWVCVLHPNHLTRVAQICYAAGIQMIQVIV
jgi:hypothetical protein